MCCCAVQPDTVQQATTTINMSSCLDRVHQSSFPPIETRRFPYIPLDAILRVVSNPWPIYARSTQFFTTCALIQKAFPSIQEKDKLNFGNIEMHVEGIEKSRLGAIKCNIKRFQRMKALTRAVTSPNVGLFYRDTCENSRNRFQSKSNTLQ